MDYQAKIIMCKRPTVTNTPLSDQEHELTARIRDVLNTEKAIDPESEWEAVSVSNGQPHGQLGDRLKYTLLIRRTK